MSFNSLCKEALSSGKKVIAVDADDVLASTNAKVAEMYNELYELDPPMRLTDFRHYLYWQNRGWGTPVETAEKIRNMYRKGLLAKAEPIKGAREGLQALKDLGFRLVLITARGPDTEPGTHVWLKENMPDLFESLHFTGAFVAMQNPDTASASPPKKRSKAAVAHALGACLLIDDSLENALTCAAHEPPLPVLLFGKYPWNSHLTAEDTTEDDKAHQERVLRGIESEKGEDLAFRLKREEETKGRLDLPDSVQRVDNWEEVVETLKGLSKDGLAKGRL